MPVVTHGVLDDGVGAIQTQKEFEKNISDDWFDSMGGFLQFAMRQPVVLENDLPDTPLTRTLLILRYYGAVAKIPKCPVCKGLVVLAFRNERYVDKCTRTHKCWEARVKGYGAFDHVNKSGWPALLLITLHMCLDDSWQTTCREVQALLGSMDAVTLTTYRRNMQTALKATLIEEGGLMIGGPNIVTVIDETLMGEYHGVGSKKQQGVPQGMKAHGNATRRRPGSHILRREPARTVWKKPSAMKSKFLKVHKKPAVQKNLRERLRC